MPSSKSTVSIDITEAFKDAAAELDVGQLVKGDHFTLFDAVQGLEIGHPTMDAGLLDEGETLEDGYDVSQHLLPEEIIYIMDQLLAYQMAWHQGFSLVQNVFSSVHIDSLLSMEREEGQPTKIVNPSTGGEPNELVQTVLRAFCISVIKSCDIVIDVIRSQEYYEEEDFNTQTCDRTMLNDFRDNDYLQLLYEAYDWVQRKGRSRELSEEHSNALLARLAFNTRLLEAFIPIPEEVESLSGRHLSVEDTLQVIKSTHHLASEVPDVFTTKLQRKLASTTPPRKLNVISFDDAIFTAERISRDLAEACSCDLMGPSPDLQRIETFLWAFSARDPLPFPRAAMQTMILMFVKPVHGGLEAIESVLWRELQGLLPSQSFLSPEIFQLEAPRDQGFKACKAIKFWFAVLGPVALTYLKSLCQNKCRIRRRLTHVLRDIDKVFDVIIDSFSETGSGPVGSLSRFIQLRIILVTSLLEARMMNTILNLGFELELYSQHELARLSTYQMVIHRFMSLMRAQMNRHDTNEPWLHVARQTAASCPSLLPDEDHLRARTLRSKYVKAYYKATNPMAALHTALRDATPAASDPTYLRQLHERFRVFRWLKMTKHAAVFHEIDMRPEILRDHGLTKLSIFNSKIQKSPSEARHLLSDFGVPKIQASAFREVWAEAQLGATASSDEYWRLELKELFTGAIFMGLEFAKLREFGEGGIIGSMELQGMQYCGRQIVVPQLAVSARRQ